MYIKRTHTYKQNTQYNLKLDVYLPENIIKPSPVVIYIHGGALVSGNRKMVNANELKAVISEGISYVSVDYRLAPETKLTEIQNDIKDAINWVREEGVRLYNFDVTRVAVLGKSAGGYLALLSGTMQIKPNAIISFYGYGDILGDWYSLPSRHYVKFPPVTQEDADKCLLSGVPVSTSFNSRWFLYLRSRQTGTWASLVSGYNPLELNTKLKPYCPIFNIGIDFPPTFLLHGSSDTDVPSEQSSDMYDELIKKDIKAQLLIIPDAEHGFDSKWNNVTEEFGLVTCFLKETLNYK